MYGVSEACAKFELAVATLAAASSQSPVTAAEIKEIDAAVCSAVFARDLIFDKYCESGAFQADGYITGKSALVHLTNQSRTTINKSVERGKLIARYREVGEAINAANSNITPDHLDQLARLNVDKYENHLDRDISLLIKNANELSALHFSYVTRHWKNIVDDEIDACSESQLGFEQRKLFLSETLNGRWVIQGELDAMTGKILERALEDIIDKIWRRSSVEVRSETTHAQRRADAMGYLAAGYVNESFDAVEQSTNESIHFSTSAPLTADITIDVELLNDSLTTKEFLRHCLVRKTPITNAHTRDFVKQLLCDANVSTPVIKSNGEVELGRRVRVASTKLKRELAITSPTCTVAGCSVPASWCDAHHVKHWIDGGETKKENLVLLCRRHHTMLHQDRDFEGRLVSDISKQQDSSWASVAIADQPELINTS